MAMEWAKLLSAARLVRGNLETKEPDSKKIFLNHHARDPDRVLFSSSFRRLQGKTQVYTFPQTDFVRNRLTHTLEVSSIGRSLARGIFQRLERENTRFKEAEVENVGLNDILDIVAAACYAHDLGNPPFGHIGEYAIRSWFKERKDLNKAAERRDDSDTEPFEKRGLTELFGDEKYNDFLLFDGNAQSFRVVNRLEGWGYEDGGLCLTAATLGALIKYPNLSPLQSRHSTKPGKFGYYFSEKRIFEKISSELGLIKLANQQYCRHPLAYITEAADDIAYLTSDIEDARKFGMMSYDEAEAVLLPAARLLDGFDGDRLNRLREAKNRLKFIRSAASLAMVEHCIDTFVNNEERILTGRFEGSLLQNSGDLKNVESRLREVCKDMIYHKYKKIKSEAGAYEVIRTILSVFSEAIEEKFIGSHPISERSVNLIKLIDQHGSELANETDPYSAYIKLIDYVSGMTDRYAMEIFETFSGKRLALGY